MLGVGAQGNAVQVAQHGLTRTAISRQDDFVVARPERGRREELEFLHTRGEIRSGEADLLVRAVAERAVRVVEQANILTQVDPARVERRTQIDTHHERRRIGGQDDRTIGDRETHVHGLHGQLIIAHRSRVAAAREEGRKVLIPLSAQGHIVGAGGQVAIESTLGLGDQPVPRRIERIAEIEEVVVVQSEDGIGTAISSHDGQMDARGAVQREGGPIHVGRARHPVPDRSHQGDLGSLVRPSQLLGDIQSVVGLDFEKGRKPVAAQQESRLEGLEEQTDSPPSREASGLAPGTNVGKQFHHPLLLPEPWVTRAPRSSSP